MKKILSTVVLFLLISGSVYAQFSIGPRIGANLSSISDDPDYPTGVEQSNQFNILFGAAAEIGIAGPMFIEIDLLYITKGEDVTGFVQGLPAEQTQSASLLELPILAKVKFPLGALKPYAFLGPSIGFILSGKRELTIQGQSQGEADIKDQLSSIDFGVEFGAGVSFDVIPVMSLIFDVRYSLGLTNIADVQQQQGQAQQEVSAKTRGLQFMIGAMFGL